MKVNAQPKAIFLMGATAAGKTDLAVELTQTLPCDIVSVDSALIYKGMDIGTAKPNVRILAEAPHRLIDIIHPSESYSVAQFYQDALREMNEISAAGRIPLLVGGTMMYFRMLSQGIAALPSADENVRKVIVQDAAEHGWPYVHAQLAKIDPEAAQRIKPTDPQRLQRALEVYRVSGKTMTQIWAEQKDPVDDKGHSDYTELNSGLPPVPYNVVSLAIGPSDRSVLHKRIEQRYHSMLKSGFIDEVKSFHTNETMHADMPSMKCVGYRQVWDYLDSKLNYDEMVERGIIATRQLAKRQLTWLRRWPNLNQLETNDSKVLAKAIEIIENTAY
ncbi:MAG: tRNA dimethylallyltransferase [Pseudohongiellaceae bacterium]|jgi:tRNA dimethylallyltransferase